MVASNARTAAGCEPPESLMNNTFQKFAFGMRVSLYSRAAPYGWRRLLASSYSKTKTPEGVFVKLIALTLERLFNVFLFE